MSRKRAWTAGLTLAAALVAAGLWTWKRHAATPIAAPTTAAEDVGPDVLIPAVVQAASVTLVAAPIEGTIESFAIEVGEDVSEGQLLAHIRNTDLESAREETAQALESSQEKLNRLESAVIEGRLESSRASADASRARSEYERAQKVFERQQVLLRAGATPRLTFEKAEKEFQTAQSEFETLDNVAKQVEDRVASMSKELDNARRLLEEKRQEHEMAVEQAGAADVRSPVDGLVVGRRGAEGEQVSRDMKDFFQIAVDLSVLNAIADLDPKTLPRVRAGQPALLHFSELSNEGVPALVKDIKDGKAILEFSSPGTMIKPGTQAQARIRVAE